jgi:ribosomal protein S18 acetylase RimI-like enzyme
MVMRFMESHALTGYAAMEDGRVVGYSFYVYENFKGLVGDLFVSPGFRNSGAGNQLLTHVLETLQAMPGIRRIEAQMVNLDGETLRQRFVTLGFRSYERQFLLLGLSGWTAPEGENATAGRDGHVHVEPWQQGHFEPAARLIVAAYRGHVDSLISDQYRTQEGAVRFLENIVRFPGCGAFLPETSLLAFSGGSRVPSAMILTSVVSDHVAHITQLCAAPEHRGHGLGRRLLLEALELLRQRGFLSVTLTATVANEPAVALYRGLGFTPLSTFPAFTWEADAAQQVVTLQKAAARR